MWWRLVDTLVDFSSKMQMKVVFHKEYQSISVNGSSPLSKYLFVTYFSTMSNRIARLLSHHNINVRFKLPYKVGDMLVLIWSGCNSVSIDMANTIGYHEHLGSFKESMFWNHFFKTGHTFPKLEETLTSFYCVLSRFKYLMYLTILYSIC